MTVWGSADAAAQWNRSAAVRELALAQATDMMLRLARIRPADRVLNVGAGTGDEALAAARMVESSGSVLATDISGDMLEVAARRAADAGLANVTTRVLAGEEVGGLEPESFDAVISRLGLMFVPHLVTSLQGMAGVLRSGGRLAAVVWDELSLNPYLGTPIAALESLGRELPPDSVLRAAFSLSGERLAEALQQAGFENVEGGPVPANRTFASVDEAVEALKDLPALPPVIGDLAPNQSARLWSLVEASFARFVEGGQVVVPGMMRVYGGTRP